MVIDVRIQAWCILYVRKSKVSNNYKMKKEKHVNSSRSFVETIYNKLWYLCIISGYYTKYKSWWYVTFLFQDSNWLNWVKGILYTLSPPGSGVPPSKFTNAYLNYTLQVHSQPNLSFSSSMKFPIWIIKNFNHEDFVLRDGHKQIRFIPLAWIIP